MKIKVHCGVKGLVLDSASGQPIQGAVILVRGNSHGVTTTASGEYWRLLPPGEYLIAVAPADEEFDDYLSYQEVSVGPCNGPGSATRFDFHV